MKSVCAASITCSTRTLGWAPEMLLALLPASDSLPSMEGALRCAGSGRNRNGVNQEDTRWRRVICDKGIVEDLLPDQGRPIRAHRRDAWQEVHRVCVGEAMRTSDTAGSALTPTPPHLPGHTCPMPKHFPHALTHSHKRTKHTHPTLTLPSNPSPPPPSTHTP